MAEGKNSFIAYTGWGELFTALPDEKAGQLVKILFEYVSDENPEITDPVLKIAFISIKQDLKRDLKKWEKYIDKQKVNGKMGGRPKKPKKTQKTQAFSEKPKKADNVDEDVNEDVNEKRESARPTIEMLYEFFREKGLPMGQARMEADKFYNHYDAKGWLIGKAKMKKWRAAAAGWIARMDDFQKDQPKKGKVNAGTLAKQKIYGASKD